MSAKKTVMWYMAEQGCVQFEGDADPFFVSDKVKEFLSSKPLEKGEIVEIETKKDELNDIIVEKVIRSSAPAKTTPKEEPKQEVKVEAKSEPSEVKKEEAFHDNEKSMVVHGVSVKKRTIVFKDDMEKWYDIDASLDINEIKDKFVTGTSAVVRLKGEKIVGLSASVNQPVKVEEQEKSKDAPINDKDAFYRVKELERQVRYLENQKQESIEAQAAINSANATIATLFAGKFDSNKPEDGVKVKTLIKGLAEANYNLIQELKKANKTTS